MSLVFEDGMPFKCPKDGYLVLIVGNFNGSLEARFLSFYEGGGEEYHGVKKLKFLTSNGEYRGTGLCFGHLTPNAKPDLAFANTIAMLFANAGRYIEAPSVDLHYKNPAHAHLINLKRQPDKIVYFFKPCGDLINFAPR